MYELKFCESLQLPEIGFISEIGRRPEIGSVNSYRFIISYPYKLMLSRSKQRRSVLVKLRETEFSEEVIWKAKED